jgi:hypothetical protein
LKPIEKNGTLPVGVVRIAHFLSEYSTKSPGEVGMTGNNTPKPVTRMACDHFLEGYSTKQ